MADKFYNASEFLDNLGQAELQALADRVILELDEHRRSGAVLNIHLLQAVGHEIKKRGGWKLQKQVIEEVRRETSPADARIVDFHWEDSATQYPGQAGLKCRVCSKSVNDYRYFFEDLRYGKTLGCQCSGCGDVLCAEHSVELQKATISDIRCPQCGATGQDAIIFLVEGPASSSMVVQATREGRYNNHIRPPGSGMRVERS